MTVYLGVDPGKQGAIATIRGNGIFVSVVPIPLISPGGRGRDEYDLAGIVRLLESRFAEADGHLFVTVEKSQPMPPTVPGGSAANFGRGVSRGWEWMLVVMRLSYQLVGPRTWQAVMHSGTPAGDTKQRSIIAAQRLFPQADLRRSPRCRNLDDGMAEALLLAEFGRRTHQGRL